ncbi:unnamed protein product [Malus baccata var. baccata]
MMGDPLGSSCVSSQKQNREGVVGAQSEQYRVTVEGVDHVNLICIFTSLPKTRHFGSSLASGSIGTPKLSEFTREQSHDGNKTVKAWSGPKANNIVIYPNVP